VFFKTNDPLFRPFSKFFKFLKDVERALYMRCLLRTNGGLCSQFMGETYGLVFLRTFDVLFRPFSKVFKEMKILERALPRECL